MSNLPPDAGTRRTGPVESPMRIDPALVHEPGPRLKFNQGKEASSTGPPPLRAIFRSLRSADETNATDSPSAEKNGSQAFSVPGSARAAGSVTRRW